MRRSCPRHFDATLAILEPTLVILQGRGVETWTAGSFGERKAAGDHLDEATLAGRRVLVCRFSRPAAKEALGWGSKLDGEHLKRMVQPTVRRALELL